MYTHFIRTYGANAYLIDNPISDSYSKLTNDVGMATITIPADHAAVAGLALDDQVEIWRGNLHPATGLYPYMDFRGLYRGYTLRTLENGLEVADLFLFHENEVLRRAIVAYPAGQIGTTSWTGTAANVIMQILLLDNFSGATASTVGPITRLAPATSKVLAMGATPIFTSVISNFDLAGRNVLSAWQELADVDQSVFVITKSSSTSATWLAYVDGITFATDRRATIIFDIGRENAADIELDLRTINETTVAIVAGQGEGLARTFVDRYSANYNADTNHFEGWVDGRNQETATALEAYGDALINHMASLPAVNFRPVMLPKFTYGRDYFWGDVVTLRHGGQEYVQRISQVTVDYSASNQGERVSFRFEDLP
jgi:hypothetical protein